MSDQFPSLSDVLAAHSIRQDYNHPAWGKCRCGFDPDPDWDDDAMTEEESNSWPSHSQHQADMWREACTVTMVEQLDALPDRTVILDSDDTVLRRNPWHSESPVKWYPFDGDEAYERDFGITADAIEFPARVIHNPDWETK